MVVRSTGVVEVPCQYAAASEGKVAYLSLPFVLKAAFRQKKYVLNGTPHRDGTWHLKYSWHALTFLHSLIGVLRHGRDVVRQHNPILTGSPFEYGPIMLSRKSCILNPENVNVRIPTGNATCDVVVEVLVGGKTEHGSGP